MNSPISESRTVAYVAPLVIYLLGTALAGRFSGASYAIAYSMVAVCTAAGCWILRKHMIDVRPHLRIVPGVLVGLIGIGLWILLSRIGVEAAVAEYLPRFLRPGARPAFNPWKELGETYAAAFIAVRAFGMAMLVPLAEEIFWRGFLLRWWIDPDWEQVPLGKYTFGSCAGVTLLFTLSHPEWLAAATYCLLLNALLYWRRDLWQCIVAHAVSNFTLIVYVLVSNQWQLW